MMTKGKETRGQRHARLEKEKRKKAASTIDKLLLESDSSDSEDEIPTKCSYEKDTTLISEESMMVKISKQLDHLTKEVQRIDRENKTTPPTHPVKTIKGGTKDAVSAITVGTKASKKELVKGYEAQMLTGLSKYIRNKYYRDMKFCPNDKMASIVCQESVLLGHVQIPNEFTVPQFTNYFKDKVQSALSKLRHNGQTLARRNYMGKNYYGWIQKMICNNSLTF